MTKNTDRELLTYAAKAAGIDDRVLAYDNDGTAGSFDPLNDDGDAFRLAGKLGLFVAFGTKLNRSFAERPDVGAWYAYHEMYDNDVNKAARYCIVRCAAEIGKGME